MKLEARVLENRFVRLEPMGASHKSELETACNADTRIWTELYPFSWAGEHFEPTWEKMMGRVASGETIAFAVLVSGSCIGLSWYGSIDAANASVEIGGTYYRPDHRGGAVNPACKRLLMGHAFEGGARRVVFRVDALNARSRAAVLKLGAVEEALLRQDRVTWTGRIRDTVIFSVLDREWPTVRARLDERLATFG